jgi:hypothetical protein
MLTRYVCGKGREGGREGGREEGREGSREFVIVVLARL